MGNTRNPKKDNKQPELQKYWLTKWILDINNQYSLTRIHWLPINLGYRMKNSPQLLVDHSPDLCYAFIATLLDMTPKPKINIMSPLVRNRHTLVMKKQGSGTLYSYIDSTSIFFLTIELYTFFFWLYLRCAKILGQGLNPCHSKDPYHNSDNGRSLTH